MANLNIKVIFISVVRDFGMYDRLVRQNRWNAGGTFVTFDNRKENKGVAERYNSFLDTYDFSDDAWFVFCHEDWEARESLSRKLKHRSPSYIYGPIGSRTVVTANRLYQFTVGYCAESDRNGEGTVNISGFLPAGDVDTLDCQCVIVHSSLIRKYHLRFDPYLTFDMYAEEFCINAYERHGIVSRAIGIDCRHWSHGNITDRFHAFRRYVSSKYSGIYTTTVGGNCIGNAGNRKIVIFKRFFLNHPEKYYIYFQYRRRGNTSTV